MGANSDNFRENISERGLQFIKDSKTWERIRIILEKTFRNLSLQQIANCRGMNSDNFRENISEPELAANCKLEKIQK